MSNPCAESTGERQVLRIKEAASILGLGENQTYQAARSGQIPAIRVGRRWLIPRVQLEAMLAGQNEGGSQ